MKNLQLWIIVLFLPSLATGCAPGPGGNVMLAVSDQNPVVLLEPKTGMTIDLSAVLYDQFGRIESYEAKLIDGEQSRTINVHQMEKAVYGKSAEYTAEADGSAIPTLADSQDSGAIGFTLKDQGGVVLTYVGTLQMNMKTELGYDENGTPHVARQTFTHDGKSYDISYSEHSYDKGRPLGYKALIQKAD